MRLFITGASGFVGRRALRELTEGGHEILALARGPEAAAVVEQAGASAHVGTLNDPATYEAALSDFGPEACLHMAWEGIPDFSAMKCRGNLLASTNLFDRLAQIPSCRRVVVTGSCFEYGRTQGQCGEEDAANPTTFFTWAKHAVQGYGRILFAARPLEFLWCRIFYVYGPGQRSASLVPSIVSALRAGEAPRLQQPWNANDFVYVDDVARGLCAALTGNAPAGIYNLGSGVATTVHDVHRIASQMIRGIMPAVPDVPPAGASNFWADPSKSATVLSWRAGTSLESGIRQYVDTLSP